MPPVPCPPVFHLENPKIGFVSPKYAVVIQTLVPVLHITQGKTYLTVVIKIPISTFFTPILNRNKNDD